MFILSSNYDIGKDWLMTGFARILVIIAILQLVKKIPDIINTIFGTKIQTKGGIKGRLGEMAGIGGVAQKAWTSLGNGAKNLAKLGLTAPAALGYGIGNRLFKMDHGKDIADTKAGRILRGVGSGAASAVKTGSWVKTKDAALASYNKTSTSPVDKARRAAQINKEINDATTNAKGNNIANETNINEKISARQKLDNVIRENGIKKDSAVDKANEKYQNRVQAANITQAMAKNFSTILDENERAAQHWEMAGRSDLAQKLRTMNETFKASGMDRLKDAQGNYLKDENGNFITGFSKMQDFVKNNQDLYGSQVANNLIGENGKLTSMQRQYEYMLSNGKNLGLTDQDLGNVGRGEASVSFLANTTLKGRMDSAKSDLDLQIEGAKLDEMAKLALNKTIAAETDISNSMGFAIGRKDSESGRSSKITGFTTEQLENSYTESNDTNRTTTQPGQDSSNSSGGPTSSSGPTPAGGPTTINNYYGNNGTSECGESSKKDGQSIKVDTSDMEKSIEKMGDKLSNTVTTEGENTRKTIVQQGKDIKSSTDEVRNAVSDLANSLNKPIKEDDE